MEHQRESSRLFSGAIASIFAIMVAVAVAVSGTGLDRYTSVKQQFAGVASQTVATQSDSTPGITSSSGETTGSGANQSGSASKSESFAAEPGQSDRSDHEGQQPELDLGSAPHALAMVDRITNTTDTVITSGAGQTSVSSRDGGTTRAGTTPTATRRSASHTTATRNRSRAVTADPKIRTTTVVPTTANTSPAPTTRTSTQAATSPAPDAQTAVPPSTSTERIVDSQPATLVVSPEARRLETNSSIASRTTTSTSAPPATKPQTAAPAIASTPAAAPSMQPQSNTTATTVRPTTRLATTPAPPAATVPINSPTRTLYVDGDNGRWSNPGTEAEPFGRPIDALIKAEPGTTIYIRGGTYSDQTHGTNIIARSGTAENWIRIAPYPGERVELVAGGEWGNGFEVQGASFVEISGFVIRGRSDSIHGSGIFGKNQSHDVRIADNYIEGFGGAGISFIESSRIEIDGNEVRNNAMRSYYQGSGISIYRPEGATGSGFSNVIRNNYVVGNRNEVRSRDGRITDGNCIILDEFDLVSYKGSTLIENNLCVENGGRGVLLFWSSNTTARNNTLIGNGWSPDLSSGRGEMAAGHGTNISFYNNLVFNRPGTASFVSNDASVTFTNNYVSSTPPTGSGNQLLDPNKQYFASATANGPSGNYRPVSSSGLAGTGRNDLQSNDDLSGRSRPPAGTVGAFEQ